MATRYDVAIIGTGAGGGTLAYALAPTGKNILLLERGDYVPREKDNWDTRAVNLEGKYNTKEVWRDRDGKELHPHTNYYVGGNTKFYGAALFRLRREDFGEVKHWGGVSPAWPIAYEDLEPSYTRAEQLYHVHGERGVDPTDPPARAPYPHPPVSHEPRIRPRGDAHRRRAPGDPRDVCGRRRRRRMRRDQLRGAAPALGQRPAPAWARQRLRRRRAPLHGSRELGPHGPLEVPQSHGLPENARAERLLLRIGGVGVPDGP